ncbi:MAG: DNA polymerase III subunit beta [Clostridia bacterium]|nr:DNA polymerase III subunit beta [Clostridia bacterium]
MKFSCQGLELADAVLKVVKAAAVRTTNPILECVKMVAEDDRLTLTCTDLELTITKSINADVKVSGVAVIPAKFFADFVSKISGEQLEFNLHGKTLDVVYGDNSAFFQCQDATEFPEPKTLEQPEYVEIASEAFKDLVTKSSVAVAQDDSRPMLRGILLEVSSGQLRGVALDGVRLALVQKSTLSQSAEFGLVVSARCLLEIVRLLPDNDETIRICTQKNHLQINLGNTQLMTRLMGMQSDYVSYRQILPKDFTTTINVNRKHILDAMERAGLFSRVDRNFVVKFDITGREMVINSESELGNLTEHLQITHNGADLAIEFNGKLYNDALRVITDEFVQIRFGSAVHPCVIVPQEGDDYLYLILPMHKI